MTIVQWQCQNKLCNYSLKLYTALTHLNKDDYVSELTWHQWYEHSGYFQSFIKIRSRCTSIATVPARKGDLLTLLLRFTWITNKVFFSFSVTRDGPHLPPTPHSSTKLFSRDQWYRNQRHKQTPVLLSALLCIINTSWFSKTARRRACWGHLPLHPLDWSCPGPRTSRTSNRVSR